MNIECRLVTRAGWKDACDGSETVVEIFEPRSPVRCDCNFGAQPNHPTGACAQNRILIVDEAGCLDEARLGLSQSACAVNQPTIERVAETPAQRGDIVDLVGDDGALGCRS